MHLYKFLSAEFALDNLLKRRMKISEFHDMNDPFELQGVSVSDPLIDKFVVDHNFRSYGSLCFTEGWTHPLLWSLYADRHKGICLGFDIDPSVEVFEPSYVSNREKIDASTLMNTASTSPDFITAADMMARRLWTKFEEWRFERERRVFIRLQNEQKDGPFYFADFDHNLRPCTVILGKRCAVADETVRKAIVRYDPKIEVKRATLSPTHFAIVEDASFEWSD
jgi:hypothetical protein